MTANIANIANKLISFVFKGEANRLVNDYRKTDKSLNLKKAEIDSKATAIFNANTQYFQGCFEGAKKIALKSTLEKVIRNEKTLLVAKTVCHLKLFPGKTANEIALHPELGRLSDDDLITTVRNQDKIFKLFKDSCMINEVKSGEKRYFEIHPESGNFSSVSKFITKELKKFNSENYNKYLENKVRYAFDEEGLSKATKLSMEKIRQCDNRIINDLKETLFKGITEETLNYIISTNIKREFQFRATDLFQAEAPHTEACLSLYNALTTDRTKRKINILQIIEEVEPKLLKSLTKSQQNFLRLTQNRGLI